MFKKVSQWNEKLTERIQLDDKLKSKNKKYCVCIHDK